MTFRRRREYDVMNVFDINASGESPQTSENNRVLLTVDNIPDLFSIIGFGFSGDVEESLFIFESLLYQIP